MFQSTETTGDQREPTRGGLFSGDDWRCECGNTSHHEGFYPCLVTGQFVEPAAGKWADGDLYRCDRCDVVIEHDPVADEGWIIDMTLPEFIGQSPMDAA